MTNHNILELFLDIQRDMMFSKSIFLENARIIYNESDPTSYWNYALIKENLDIDKVVTIGKELESLKRTAAIYLEHSDVLKLTEDLLIKNRYTLHNEDSWMFFEDGNINTAHFASIQRVESTEDLNVWVNTIDKCYLADDQKNPYGPLGAYLHLAKRAWEAHNEVGRFEYYIAFKDGKPVAVATLTFQENLAYISNVGSVLEARGLGFGKAITLYCVQRAKDKNVEEICLATEEGTNPNEFYKNMGFVTRFTARGYVKSKVI